MVQKRLPDNMIHSGELYPVTVLTTTAKGIIVHLDNTEYTAFIHISKIAKGFVYDVNDYVSQGDKFDALGTNRGDKPELILSHLDLKPKTKSTPVSEKYTPSQHIPKSLDDMISDANKSYKDKFGSKEAKQRSRKRCYKNHNDFE